MRFKRIFNESGVNQIPNTVDWNSNKRIIWFKNYEAQQLARSEDIDYSFIACETDAWQIFEISTL